MTCDRVRTRLSAYVDQELSAGLTKEVELHLPSCESCRHELARLQKLAFVLAANPLPPVPVDLAERILRQSQMPRTVHRRIHIPRMVWWNTMPGYMRAAAVVVLMVGLTAGTFMGLSVSPRDNSPLAAIAVQDSALTSSLHLDIFSDSPSGSPAEAYLAMATPSVQGER